MNAKRHPRRYECWVKQVSLEHWITARDSKLAPYVSRPEARRTLGLYGAAVLRVAQAGLIRYVQGSEHGFRPGFYFLREDICRIKQAFERHAVPVLECPTPREFIALGNAALYVGRDHGLAALIRAVVDGALFPIARTNRFAGINGYLFRAEEVRRYRSVSGVQTPPGGFFTYTEAASRLGWASADVISGLVAEGIVAAPARYQRSRARFVPISEIERFSRRYIAVKALAQHLKVAGDWLRSPPRKT